MENPKELRSDADFSFEFFPFEMIIEILSRLPVKVLGRFTTVSKLWYSLITSYMFINKHLKDYSISLSNKSYSSGDSSSSSATPFSSVLLIPIVLKELERHSYSMFFDSTFDDNGSFEIPMLYHWLEILYVGNSCNGIICFTDQKAFFGRKVYLYNPVIRRMKLISHNCFADMMFDRNKVFCKLGFGFCECTNDYKVVRIHYVKDEESKMLGNVAPEVEVYSLNADNWRRIKANVECIVNYRSVSCNGSIHWLARKKNGRIFDAIMSFDIAHELFCETDLPVQCHSLKDGTLLVFKGLLAIFKDGISIREYEGYKCYELWVMREYKVAKSWTKLFVLETKRSVVKAFGFTKSGQLVMQMHGDRLASWEPEGNCLKHLEIDGFLHHVDASFVESLVLYEGGCFASAETNTIVAETSQSMRIMDSRELLSSMDTLKVPIHGDEVAVRVAADVASLECGISELKSLCWRRPALVCIMAKPRDSPSTVQLCVENYCLLIKQDDLGYVPESLRDFLANPEICFVNVGPDRLYLGPFFLERNGIEFSHLVYRVLRKHYFSRWGLKPLADEVGVVLEEYPARFGLDCRTEAFSAEDVKWAIYHVYASFRISSKLFGSL
ncbi:F-box/kelch-repeat protein At3g06240-like [Coffea eugenioides]|uniref:F-box/kelch-repeat protein At3g06240 n=1 Tax=Coffea arabica TaxID=13443 RepID=A0A6P6WH48_COFAR|nr:F-box/kelch-repeat protein At3g06240-like [Coffea arabica]XP_027160792.1 F-box/kelch-repeat protein At3g06240-like [Coffea eugenioides]